MNLALKKKIIMKSHPSYVSVKQRIVGFFTVTILLLQICLPTVASAARLLTNESVTAAMASPSFQRSNSNAYLYQQASFDDAAYIGSQNITTFRERLVAAKSNLGKPTFIPIASDITIFVPTYPTGKLIGDVYVQNRYIRQQVFELLGRNLIYANSSEISETAQINLLYENAYAYAQKNPSINFGDNLNAGALTNFKDMVWPEIRTIHNERVVVPVLYLTDETVRDNKVTKTRTEFTGDAANFGSISLNNAELTLGVRTITKIAGSLSADKSSLINSYGDINLVVGGTLNLIGSSITGEKNVTIFANEMNIKSVLVPFQDRYGSGTKLGTISSINSTTGNISLASTGNVTFEGGTATASNGSLTIKSGGNISILPLFATYQGQSTQNDWKVNSSSLDVIGSRLSARDLLSLSASGAINITASELISTQGGIELLAKNGIYIIDELEQDQIQKVDRKGKTTGQSSEFRTEAVRAILKAGKGVLLDSEFGDVILKATEITSAEGAQVNARNGKVHLLMTKELEEFHLQTVKKSTWTIKARTEDVVHENNIQNAIVGGLQVQAKYGINVEYTGKEGATLKEQVEEFRKVPEMKWMADLYDQAVIQGGQAVNWEVMEEVHKELKKTKRNLSPAAMAIIAICVAVAMGPAGAGLFGSSGGGAAAAISNSVGGGTFGAAMSAGAVTLTTQAVQSFAAGNSLRETLSAMDSSESLKSLAVSMVTAGAMQHTDLKVFKVVDDTPVTAANLAKQATQAVFDSAISAGVSTIVYGGNFDAFEDAFVSSLASAAVNKLGKEMAEKIGAAFDSPENLDTALKYISHAASGCIIGAAKARVDDSPDTDGACYVGAGGAVVGEVIASHYRSTEDIQNAKKAVEDFIKENGDEVAWLKAEGLNNQEIIEHFSSVGNFYATVKRLDQLKQAGVDLAKLGAAFGAFFAGADGAQINIAASTGANAAENNALSIFSSMKVMGMAIDGLEVDLSGAVGPVEQMMIAGADGLVELALSYQELQDGAAGGTLVTDPFYGDPLSEPAVMGGVIAGVLDTANILGLGADAFLRLSADYHAGNLDLTSSATMDRLKGLVQEIGNAANIVINIDDFSAKVQGALITAASGDRRAQAEVARFTTNMTISVLAGGMGAGTGTARAVAAVDKSIVRLHKLGEEGKLDADALFKQEGFKVEAVSQNEFKVISIPSQIPKLPNPWTDAKFNHVWKGDYSGGYKKLSGGMHTQSGLEEFKSVNAGVGRVFDEKVVANFSSGVNSTSTILKQELPNGVIRVHLPNEGINKRTRQGAVATNNQGEEVRGIKTLFPSNWTKADIKNAGQFVINQQGGIIKEGQISGVYKGVKIEVRLDKASGIINTVHPSWEQ